MKTAHVLLCAFALATHGHAELLVKSGDTIAFLGDSITRQGAGPEGWCGIVVSSLKTLGIDATQINAGRGGNTSRDMAARFENDVIAKKPAWMTLLCGTNDNPGHGLPLEESEKNIRTIVEKSLASGIKVLMMTKPVRGGKLTDDAYNEFIRKFAKEKGLPLADVWTEMKNRLVAYRAEHPSLPPNAPPLLTVADGTHMNQLGNQVIAECVLGAFGVTSNQLTRAKQTWPPIPLPSAAPATVPK